jgi:uroporphyrinogen decarboxylase
MVPEQCRRHQGSAIFIGGAGLGDIINSTGFLLGMEETLVRLLCGDEALLSFIDRRLEVQLMVAQRELEAARGAVDFLWMGEDLGSQIAPMISLQLYRQVIRPRHQRVVDLAKAYDLPVMIHSCGYSSWAYDDFIEMGISVVDTLQPEATHMSPRYLKKRYGGRLAFHGCISTAGPVAYGTVEDVVASCRETLAIMMPGGGYCFAPTHALQDNSPTENVVAMYETARRCGRYA